MNIALNKPYHFFFLIAPIILAFGFSKSKGIFNINIHDTYFVIKYAHLGIILSVFYFLLGFIHFFISKKGIEISNWIIYLHTILSVGGLILIWILSKLINNAPQQNFEETLKIMRINEYLNFSCIILFLSMLLIQVIFFVSVLWKLAKSIF
ncbi:hypothetical protein B6A10_03970 [Flavobacterium sp. L1I52]|uniref:Uncharacterized protein n=1 Tax=Flavobacterium pokkalii TaxID=1940408 RepID=A0ABR7UNL7_9FLAO|nr:hypothetical protein [Flavobacterium pokkalii]MBD0724329.1 hypothetical protein [Flavobacterium pokkalii]